MEGCLLHAIIVDDRVVTDSKSYAEIVQDIVLFKTREELDKGEKEQLENRLNQLVKRCYRIILDCWQSDEFEGTIVYDWSKLRTQEIRKNDVPPLCQFVVRDAIDYLDLLLRWHVFTRAVQRLKMTSNGWLFDLD